MRLGRKQGWNAMLGRLACFLWSVPGSGCFEVGSVIVQPVYRGTDLDASVEADHGQEMLE